MPNCVAIKGDGTPCGHNAVLAVVQEAIPPHLHFCTLHDRHYQRRVVHAGHHQAGRCHYYSNQHWCEHNAVDGGNLCPVHIIRTNVLQERAHRQAEDNERVRLIRVGFLNEQPLRPWRVIVDDVVARGLPPGIGYRAALEVYLIRQEGPRVLFNTYWDWVLDRIFIVLYANALVLRFLDTFKEFPPRAAPSSFTISAAVEKMKRAMESAGG